MKKITFMTAIFAAIFTFVFNGKVTAQQSRPCVLSVQINHGGNSCSQLNGQNPDGRVTLTFDGPVDPNNIPIIVHVMHNGVTVNVTFGPGNLLQNGRVEYCYYCSGNGNCFQGNPNNYVFSVGYHLGNVIVPCVPGGPLPVDMSLFTANRDKYNTSVVVLKWQTATEINNSGFRIERNTTGTWDSITFVSSQVLGGNSQSLLTYSYNDQNNTKGISQYRIRSTDLNGKYKYSEIRAVRGVDQVGRINIYPNPSSGGRVVVVFKDPSALYDVSVIDIEGRTVKEFKAVVNNVVIENLPHGIFNVRIINHSTSEQIDKEVKKIVVQ